MSIQFDQFKSIFEVFYPRYKSWVEYNRGMLPSHRIENSAFTMQEASDLLLEFFETIKIVLENKEQCLKHVSNNELSSINDIFSIVLAKAKAGDSTGDYSEFASRVDELIPRMRPFQFLSMEKVDEKRGREISEIDKNLSEIERLQKVVTSTVNKAKSDSENLHNLVESITERNKKLDELINENNQKTKSLEALHNNAIDRTEWIGQYVDKIDNILNGANEQKSKIDSFVNLIQEREEKITSQNVASEEHEKNLDSFSVEYQEKLKDFSEKYDLNMAEARKLIEESHAALNLSTAIGLGKAFYTRQQKLERWWIKLAWLAMGISAVGIAVSIGYTFLEKDLNIEAVVGRSLLMTVLVAVAAFFSRQYSRNRVLEEDYAYKVALVASYPGLATEFKDADARKEYVVKLLDEILQDPQRARHDKESSEDNNLSFGGVKKNMKGVANKTDEAKPN